MTSLFLSRFKIIPSVAWQLVGIIITGFAIAVFALPQLIITPSLQSDSLIAMAVALLVYIVLISADTVPSERFIRTVAIGTCLDMTLIAIALVLVNHNVATVLQLLGIALFLCGFVCVGMSLWPSTRKSVGNLLTFCLFLIGIFCSILGILMWLEY